MANSMNEEIKQTIEKRLEAGDATWGEVCGDVARHLKVEQAYVERAMGEMVRQGRIKRQDASRGMPKYTLLTEQKIGGGAIEGKYRPFTERRLEAETTKSGTFEENPWKRTVNNPEGF